MLYSYQDLFVLGDVDYNNLKKHT